MKNVELFNQLQLPEVAHSDSREISGGVFWEVVGGLLIKLLIDEWPTTKQAAKDTWNGTYNPPFAR